MSDGVPDDPLPRSERVRRQLPGRSRHRPLRRPLLLNHKTFLSVGHDEYWSGPQRANVEAARDAGVNLAFFSGNEIFWKTRWEPSIDGTNTSYRTLVCYKETAAQRQDRSDADLDRHLARSPVQPAVRRGPPGERAERDHVRWSRRPTTP